MSPNDKNEAFQSNRLHGDINAWTKWCQVLGGAADVAEDDQKIQLFILAFNQIKEVESGVAFGSRERWCCFILVLPGWCEVNSLAGNWSQWSQWDHPEVARLSDMMTIHLAIQQCTKFEGIPWGEHVFFFRSTVAKPSYRIGSWFDLLMEQGRSFSCSFVCQGFWRRMTLRRTSPSWPRTMLRKTADNLTHRRWLHSMDDLFDQGQVFNIYSK